MAKSARRDNEDPKRARRVRSDRARKRAALRYTCHGRSPPLSLLRRETEEYDCARGRLFSGTGSSSGASSSRSSITPVKREPEAEAGSERRAGGVVGPEDFLPPPSPPLRAQAGAILPAMLARSAWEESKKEEWRREAAKQERIFVDLTFDDDSD